MRADGYRGAYSQGDDKMLSLINLEEEGHVSGFRGNGADWAESGEAAV